MTNEETIKEMRHLAKEASKLAYSPYSTAKIGASVLTQSGKIYSGSNIENSSYGGTVCAERVAMWKAVSEGHTVFTKIYVFSKDGWPPCGMCRQVMSEFASPDMSVIIGDENDKETVMSFKEIMPLAFTPDKLDDVK